MATAYIFCPQCATQNMNTESVCRKCGFLLPRRSAPAQTQMEYQYGGGVPAAVADSRANKLKASTVIFAVLAFIIPFWPISLPLFLFLAYTSYKKPWSF